jgi:hypothetical protein
VARNRPRLKKLSAANSAFGVPALKDLKCTQTCKSWRLLRFSTKGAEHSSLATKPFVSALRAACLAAATLVSEESLRHPS